jgi:GTPase
MIGTYRAIVTNIEGTTRELLRDASQWEELRGVELIDSPGLLDFKEELEFIEQIIYEADVLFLVIDRNTGIGAKEEEIARMIIAAGKKDRTVLVVNKLEGHLIERKYMLALADFYELGFENVVGISAKEGENIDMLIDVLQDYRRAIAPEARPVDTAIPIAIVGKPNSGKSTLMNYLAKKIVSHVSPVPGTTLDYIMSDIKLGKHTFRMYDTAGIRKTARASELEKIAWDKTYKMLTFIKPIVVVMIDMTLEMTHMDLKIIGEMIEKRVPIVVALSKIDLMTNPKEKKQKMDMVIKYMEMAKWVPIVTLSGATGEGIQQLFGVIKKISEQQVRRVSTAELNKVISTAMIKAPPRFPKNKICKLYYMTQVDVNPPTFACFINDENKQNYTFTRWIDNVLRRSFGFIGVPVSLVFKEKNAEADSHADRERDIEKQWEARE